ncbi:hypothetical protein, partial [Bacillus velezensis]
LVGFLLSFTLKKPQRPAEQQPAR